MSRHSVIPAVLAAIALGAPPSADAQATKPGPTAAPASAAPPARVQPRVIVIPFTKEGEDIRKKIEDDPNLRVAISVVQQGFGARGFVTSDFIATMRAAQEGSALAIDQKSDFRTRLLEMSRADIYVQLDLTRQTGEMGYNYSLVMQSYLVANGMTLASVNASAPAAADVSIDKVVERATRPQLPTFLQAMQASFDQIQELGVPIRVEFSVEQRAKRNLATRVGSPPKAFADAIEDWLGANTQGGMYKIATQTENRMVVDEVRIPLRDPTRNNIAYSPTLFARKLTDFVEGLGVPTTRTVNGGAVYVRLQ